MLTNQELNRINKMTFNELKKELAKCNGNRVKNRLIRVLMKDKYERYKNRKQLMKRKSILPRKEKMSRQSELFEKKNNNSVNLQGSSNDEPINSILNDIQDSDDYPATNDFNFYPDHGPLDELENNRLNKLKSEIDKDYMNNNLMDRLNSDIDIRKTKSKNNKDFIPPFSDETGSGFAPFSYDDKVPKRDFRNKRLMK